MGKIRVLVASDYQIVRSALRQLLRLDSMFEVLLTEADLGKSLPRQCQLLSPDVLLLEAINSSSSLRVPAHVLSLAPNSQILFLSTNESTTYVRAILATGVLGYILKSAPQSELFQAIKQVHRGRRYLDEALRNSVPEHSLRSLATSAVLASPKHLSRREVDVLRAIALGFTTREISNELNLSPKTVQTYRERIYKKLSLHTRADLVHYAMAHSLAEWDDSAS